MKKKDFKARVKLFNGVYSEIARIDGEVEDFKLFVNTFNTLTPETSKAITDPVTSPKLEVGKWYKDISSRFLVYIEEIHSSSNDISGYGFYTDISWFDSKRVSVKDITFDDATHEEVETALIEEAKRRGFKDGVTVDISKLSMSFNPNMVLSGKIKLTELFDKGFIWFGNKECQLIYDNGKWAEIVEYPKQEIDWDKPGQLVINESGYVWLTTGIHNEYSFTGIYIKDGVATPSFRLGNICEERAKESFTLYTEPITLKNE